MNKSNMVTCSFSLDRELYNEYKSAVAERGENVKGNLIQHMIDVVNYETPNTETTVAIEEVQRMKADPSLRKVYSSFEEILKEIHDEEIQWGIQSLQRMPYYPGLAFDLRNI